MGVWVVSCSDSAAGFETGTVTGVDEDLEGRLGGVVSGDACVAGLRVVAAALSSSELDDRDVRLDSEA